MIREVTARDLSDILEIYNDAIMNTTATYDYDPYDLDERIKWYERKKRNGHPVLVYERCGKAVAFATYGKFREKAAYRYTIEHSVYVHKDCRNEGIAKALMHEIIKRAKEQGYVTMVAGIDSTNEESIIMHEKMGFVQAGVIKKAGYKFDKWLDLVFYQLDLESMEECENR